MRRILKNIGLSLCILICLLIIGVLCYWTFGWAPRGSAEMAAYLNRHFPLKGETIVAAEGVGITSGAGIRGKKRFIVTTDTGARWLYRAEVIFKVLPGQIGPAFKITSVDPFLISGPPED